MPYDASFPNLGIHISYLPRVAFTLFGLPLYWYGVLITLGVFAGICYATYEAKRTGQNPEMYHDFVLYALVLSVIGARLYYVVFAWDTYKDDLLSVFNIRNGGLAIYGGIITAITCAIVYTRIKRIPFGLFADTAAPALLLGQAIGRWGNFFNREAFGTAADTLFALRYPASAITIMPEGVSRFMIDGISYIQVHPTFLYESAWNFALFIFMNLYKTRKKYDGEIFLLYLLGYGIGRFWIESLRTDQLLLWGTQLAVSQLLSLVLAVCAAAAMYIKRRNTVKG